MESPWYVRELTHCEVDQNPRFDSVEMPCVVCPVPDASMVSDVVSNVRAERAVIAQEPATDTAHPNTAAQLQRASHDVVASDVRQTIVALLVAKEIGVPGRWLDVYAARKADNEPVYVIIPAPKLKCVIPEELAPLIDRMLDHQETSWILYSEDIDKLLGSGDSKLRAA